MVSVLSNEASHQAIISRWYREIKSERVSPNDDPRAGAPKRAVTQGNVDAVCNLIKEDQHVTYHEIEPLLGISKTSIQKNLREQLCVNKIVFRWISHLLTEDLRVAKISWCEKNSRSLQRRKL